MKITNPADLNNILKKFNIQSEVEEYGDGHINDTYAVKSSNYILQRINTNIFKNPEKLMENIDKVTAFLRTKMIQAGEDPDRGTLTVIKTADNQNLYKADSDNVFRVYKFIDNTVSVTTVRSLDDLYHAGKGFGHFQSLLDDFPADSLHETIKDFHNTPQRYNNLIAAISADKAGRVKNAGPEIEFAVSQQNLSAIVDGLMQKTIPIRVTHNDTKINNILFDKNTGEAVCVIDLDTVMPGSALYDFGDALRIAASTADEDETDLNKVHFSAEAFEYFTKGYFEEMLPYLTDTELNLLTYSAKLITLECGMRFLTDYLEGDVYFKIHRPNHNLDRARNQFALVRDIIAQEDKLNNIIKKLSK